MPFGLIGLHCWRSCGRLPEHCRRPSRSSSRNHRSPSNLAADVHPNAIGRGIAEQIALACRISPVMAARRLDTARALWFELPDTYSQLSAGELSERVAEVVVSETRHLDPDTRRQVDRRLAAGGISKLGFKAAASCTRKTSYEPDRGLRRRADRSR
jgi:hypothetical protein